MYAVTLKASGALIGGIGLTFESRPGLYMGASGSEAEIGYSLGKEYRGHVVYTKEAETADQYIEKFARDNNAKYRITVATSDGLEQMIIRGQGCLLLSSREFEKEVKEAEDELRANHLSRPVRLGHTMEESLHKSKENSEA